MALNETILKALNWRYAAKIFDPSKPVSEEDFGTILESARLAPSAFGIEPWKFFVIENPEVRAKLRAVGYDQPKITDASKLVVIAYRTDMAVNGANELITRTAVQQGVGEESLMGLRSMVEGSMSRGEEQVRIWAKAQAYIPLGMMIETAALLGVDAGPMEGFDPAGVDEVLGLKEQNLASTSMIAFGYRGEDPAALRPKVRRVFEEVVEFVK